MLQTVKLKHFLNKWKVSSNLDFFLFCLCSPEPKVQAPVDFTLTIFTCTFYFIFFSPAPLCQYSIQTWLKTYWCEGAFKGFFFSKWRICTPIREIQCKNNEKDEILYYVNCPFSYDKKNLPWFWLFSNDRK